MSKLKQNRLSIRNPKNSHGVRKLNRIDWWVWGVSGGKDLRKRCHLAWSGSHKSHKYSRRDEWLKYCGRLYQMLQLKLGNCKCNVLHIGAARKQIPTKMNKSSSGDEIPQGDVTYHFIWLLIYYWTTTHLYFRNIFKVTRTFYISNGRSFAKSALHILLLSNFRVFSIN